ncbi:MAG TPA: hypothetical protein DDW29_17050 [Gammaproteobacteria bacterium]|nr:hypothetical protein [Gammaproteobacteria bacterium]|tara:strand:+ start:290 stop:553 length:264 start_codon:yes stop_codon:yes gene_type:complete
MFVDVQEYYGLHCERNQTIRIVDMIYSTKVFFPGEVFDGFYQVSIGYGVGGTREDVIELPRQFLIAKDGNSLVLYEGDKTYISYTKL